ncbi:MAG: flagellin N-terminal helical domain-containing protein [Candidatus Nucleicultricaceae bacterium]
MSLMRVADTPNYNSAMRSIMQTQDKLAKNLNQMSTGYKVDSFSGIAAETQSYLNLRVQSVLTEGNAEELNRVDSRLSFVEDQVKAISDHIATTRVRLTAALNPTQNDTGFATYAEDELDFLQTVLNMKDAQNQALFGGTCTDSNPCDLSLMGPPGLSPSYAYALDSGVSRTVSIGTQKDISYDILARDDAFAEYIYSLQLIRDNPPSADPQSPAYQNLQRALDHLKKADVATAELIDKVGTTRKNIGDMRDIYQEDQKYSEEMSMEMISVDPAEAIIKMIQLQVQLGATLHATREIVSNQQAINILGR